MKDLHIMSDPKILFPSLESEDVPMPFYKRWWCILVDGEVSQRPKIAFPEPGETVQWRRPIHDTARKAAAEK